MLPKNYIRLNAKPPGGKFPPPRNFVDFFYDTETGKIVARDHSGGEIFFSADGAASTGDLTTSDGSSEAGAGTLGEYKLKGATIPIISSGSPIGSTLQPMVLTPGDWEVTGHATITETNGSATLRSAAISTSSNSFDVSSNRGYADVPTTDLFGSISIAVPSRRFLITQNTTIYLVGEVTYSAGTFALTSLMTARRVR
jgi:hypothetical protein